MSEAGNAGIQAARFDAYSATFNARPGDIVERLKGAWPHVQVEGMPRGRQGYRQSWKLSDGTDTALLMANSPARPDEAHLSVQGAWSHDLAGLIRSEYPEHRCSRLDACLDFDGVGIFDKLHAEAKKLAVEHDVKTSFAGDWEGLEDGRTYYIGAPSSVARTRIYEKGQQLRKVDPLASPHLVRVETQVRPQKEAKRWAARIPPGEVFAGSIVSLHLINLLAGENLEPLAFGNRRKPPSSTGQRSMWLARQYSALIMDELLPAVGGSMTDLADLLIRQCRDKDNPRVVEEFLAGLYRSK